MLTSLINSVPDGVWGWSGAVALAVLGPWIGYRLGRSKEHASEQGEIHKELFKALSTAKRLEAPRLRGIMLGDPNNESVKAWNQQHGELWSKIADLLARSTARGIHKRLRNLKALSEGYCPHSWEAVAENRDWDSEHLERVILDDAREVLAAVLRGERVRPVRDSRSSAAWIEVEYLSYGGVYPKNVRPSRRTRAQVNRRLRIG